MIDKGKLNYLWTKFEEEKFSEVVSEINDITKGSDEKMDTELLKLLGLCYFKQGQYNLSEEVFIMQTMDSENSDDWFNLLTSSTLNKNIELSEKAFNKVIEFYEKNGTEQNLPIPYVYFYYMQALRDVKEYEKAFEQLKNLKNIYSSLSITDSTFLHLRGVPFFEHTIDASKKILENIDKNEAVSFIAELKEKVDDYGSEYLEKFEKTLNYNS